MAKFSKLNNTGENPLKIPVIPTGQDRSEPRKPAYYPRFANNSVTLSQVNSEPGSPVPRGFDNACLLTLQVRLYGYPGVAGREITYGPCSASRCSASLSPSAADNPRYGAGCNGSGILVKDPPDCRRHGHQYGPSYSVRQPRRPPKMDVAGTDASAGGVCRHCKNKAR